MACSSVLTLQRHFSTSTKFAHVESRFCGGKQRGKAASCTSTNPCARRACSRSVAVGLVSRERMMLKFDSASLGRLIPWGQIGGQLSHKSMGLHKRAKCNTL